MKIIEGNDNHLWTDALHARELARQADNRWDRGTYVRWAIMTAWTVLEMACQDALDDTKISYSFKVNLDKAIASKSLPELKWGCGIWQKVCRIQELRKDFVHRFREEKELFPDAKLAEDSLEVIRAAVKEIYQHVGKPMPRWLKDNFDRGWAIKSGFFEFAAHCSDYENVPGAFKITYVYKDKEELWQFLAPDSDMDTNIQNLIDGIDRPISAVKVYVDGCLIREESIQISKIRGSI